MLNITTLLTELVKFDTTAPRPGSGRAPNYLPALTWLDKLCREIGCATTLFNIPAAYTADAATERFNLIARLARPGKPRAFIYTHVDVVPAGNWQDAFNPRVEDLKLYGRGASDMKSGIIAALAAIDLLKNRETSHDITLLVTTDEETDQAEQARYLFKHLALQQGGIEGALLLDIDSSAGGVDVACLGTYQFDIAIFGRACHSTLPHRGENAIENAFRLGTHLLQLQNRIHSRTSSIKAEPGSGIEYMKPTLSCNIVNGGDAANTIPDLCTLTVDRRFIPEEDQNEVISEAKKFLATIPEIRYEILNERVCKALAPKEYPETERLLTAVRQITGQGDRFGALGSGEIVEISEKYKMKLVGIGAIRPENNIHGENEFVYLRDVENLTRIIEHFFSA